MKARGKHPPQVGAIGSTIAAGLKMWISCGAIGCRNNLDVDLLALSDHLAADYRIADLVAGGRRSKCERSGCRLTIYCDVRERPSLPDARPRRCRQSR